MSSGAFGVTRSTGPVGRRLGGRCRADRTKRAPGVRAIGSPSPSKSLPRTGMDSAVSGRAVTTSATATGDWLTAGGGAIPTWTVAVALAPNRSDTAYAKLSVPLVPAGAEYSAGPHHPRGSPGRRRTDPTNRTESPSGSMPSNGTSMLTVAPASQAVSGSGEAEFCVSRGADRQHDVRRAKLPRVSRAVWVRRTCPALWRRP